MDKVYPSFHVSQFMKSFFYNILFMMFLGPFSIVILLCFENTTCLKNSSFIPMKITMRFYVMQTVIYLFFVTLVAIAVHDYKTQDEENRIDLTQLYLLAWMILTRTTIIAIRHGCDTVGNWEAKSHQPYKSLEQVKENLIATAWIIMPPEVIMREV